MQQITGGSCITVPLTVSNLVAVLGLNYSLIPIPTLQCKMSSCNYSQRQRKPKTNRHRLDGSPTCPQ